MVCIYFQAGFFPKAKPLSKERGRQQFVNLADPIDQKKQGVSGIFFGTPFFVRFLPGRSS